MNRSLSLRRRLAGAAALSLSCVLMAGPALAQAGGAGAVIVPASPLGDALRSFSDQTGVAVIFTEALVAGRTSGGVESAGNPEAALKTLLAGTGLEAVPGAGGYVIRTQRLAPSPARAGPDAGSATPDRVQPDGRAGAQEAGETDLRIAQVTVTGTSLRGIAPESSPLQIYTREDILGSGVTTTEQFIRTLPQNFGGGSGEFITLGLPNDDEAGSFGAGANLRGLGNSGTLVLLNGNRLAPTSALGNFIDLSIIPVTALERVDVLTDGASAIYGGDAVAGVVNFILRDDFDGAETTVRYGGDGKGDLEEVRVSQTFGTAWTSGSVIATYEHFRRSNLTLADRPHILTPQVVSGPNPAGADRFDLLPRQTRDTLVLSVRQDVSPVLSLSGTGLYSERDTFQSVIGFIGAGDAVTNDRQSASYALSFGALAEISSTWSASLTANTSNQTNESRGRSQVRQTESFSENKSDSRSLDLIANGETLQLPAGPVRVAFGGHLRREDFVLQTARDGVLRQATRDVSALFGEIHLPLVGPENRVPGVRRLELNLSGRRDNYSDFGVASNPKVGVLWSPAQGLRLRSSYSESFAPPALGQAGDRTSRAIVLPTSLVMQVLGLAGRYPQFEGTNYVLMSGVADDLDPQTSRTFTFGADLDHSSGPGSWSASLNYYDLEFEGRLGTAPIPDNLDPAFAPFLLLDDPSVFPTGTVIFNPTPAQISALIAGLDIPPQLQFGATFDNVGIINNVSVTRNLASTSTRGLDLLISHERQTDAGVVTIGANANYIIDFSRQAAETTPDVKVLNTLYNPADLNLRGHVGLRRGGLSGTLFVNHVAGYRSDETANAVNIDAWTTADVVLAYDFGDRSGWPGDLRLGLSVTNLFDKNPPEAPTLGSFSIAGYDPTNASPIGRFLAVQLSLAF